MARSTRESERSSRSGDGDGAVAWVNRAVMCGDPMAWAPANEFLTETDFREQVRQAALFAYEAAITFRSAGYLPADLDLVELGKRASSMGSPGAEGVGQEV